MHRLPRALCMFRVDILPTVKKILLIEDNEFLRTTTADILQLSGYQVSQAENGREGVEMAG